MNNVLLDQLNRLIDNGRKAKIGGKYIDTIPETMDAVVFEGKEAPAVKEVRVIFEDYFVHPYKGFDFHTSLNQTPPPEKVMYGQIVRETEKMYAFSLHPEDSLELWVGKCPKKSCRVEK